MKLKSARDRRFGGLPQEEFSVRLRTAEGIFVFGFHVGKRTEYWRVAGMPEEFSSEEEALEALCNRKQHKRSRSAGWG